MQIFFSFQFHHHEKPHPDEIRLREIHAKCIQVRPYVITQEKLHKGAVDFRNWLNAQSAEYFKKIKTVQPWNIIVLTREMMDYMLKMKEISILDLTGSRITLLPESISTMHSLKKLYVSGKDLHKKGISESILDMPGLKIITDYRLIPRKRHRQAALFSCDADSRTPFWVTSTRILVILSIMLIVLPIFSKFVIKK